MGIYCVPFKGYFFYLVDSLMPSPTCYRIGAGVPHLGNLFILAHALVALVRTVSSLCLPIALMLGA